MRGRGSGGGGESHGGLGCIGWVALALVLAYLTTLNKNDPASAISLTVFALIAAIAFAAGLFLWRRSNRLAFEARLAELGIVAIASGELHYLQVPPGEEESPFRPYSRVVLGMDDDAAWLTDGISFFAFPRPFWVIVGDESTYHFGTVVLSSAGASAHVSFRDDTSGEAADKQVQAGRIADMVEEALKHGPPKGSQKG